MYTALSAALVVFVAALAVTASQTPPPAIAELSPTPQKQITDAPQEQSSELGSADGGSGLGGIPPTTTTLAATGPSTTLPTIRTPRRKKCVGNPPRQTEDPQSPPCVPFWDGTDNGGATTKGVTQEEIRVAVPADGTVNSRDLAALESYFNARFELYGRRLRLISFKNAGNFTECSKMQADAVTVDKALEAFASLRYSVQDGLEGCYYDELGRRKIISLQTSGVGTPSTTEAHLAETPYQWNYHPGVDTILSNLGELICKQLKTGRPQYAGPPQSAALQRKFGLVIDSTASGVPPPDPRPIDTKLRACGLDWSKVVRADIQSQVYTDTQPMLQMKAAEVTTVVCLCGYDYYKLGMMTAATQEGYFPEWIVQNFREQDTDVGGHAYPTEQAGHVFGIRSRNRSLPRDQMPYWAAFREADPTFPAGLYNFSDQYENLLLLASGIQAAGPNLTPETFANGLQRTVFPNPGCGGPPAFQACVGFQGDHTMVNDFALEWYDPNGTSQEIDPAYGNTPFARNSGTFCYAELGKRYRAGTWPSPGPALFQGQCH
jgi:hypothetical protein